MPQGQLRYDRRYHNTREPGDKISALEFFASLGRQDAYAKRIPKTGSYVLCLEPLTAAVLRQHLKGVPNAGVYTYLSGADRTRILLFDLDDHDGKLGWDAVCKAALQLRDAAAGHGLRLWAARSGGGCGIHLSAHWAEPQPGRDVRQLAKAILSEISFKDGAGGIAKGQIEVFPKQDKIDDEMSGNLIGLPFGRASVPLDDDMQPVDQPLPWPASDPVPEAKTSTKPKGADAAKQIWTAADIDRLRSALSARSSDDYWDWVRYGQAIKHDLGEAGWLVWDGWSRQSEDKYPGEHDARRKWDSFERNDDMENPITTASIFYEAEAAGWADPDAPRPVGYTNTNGFVVYDPTRHDIITYSPEQLAKPSQMEALAGPFWRRRFSWNKSDFRFNTASVAQWLITGCKKAGPYIEGSVRGQGVWRDGEEIVVNVEREPAGDHLLHRYTCFKPIELPAAGEFDGQRLLRLLQRFNWGDDPNRAVLVLGWMATTPICGMLRWRVHIWPFGPSQCGKTTLTQILSEGAAPMVLSALGDSTAAGIRQRVRRDARGVILDDMDKEDEGEHRQLREVLRLMRLASSADQTLLRGTADHKGEEFQIACCFAITAINPRGMEIADESRTVMLQMLPHDNRPESSQLVQEELAWLRSQRGQLCRTMIDRVALVQPSIDRFAAAFVHLPSQRERQNLGTLMAAAWVALYNTVPTVEEASERAVGFAQTVADRSEAIERDPGQECLGYLFAHTTRTKFGDYPLWHWIGVAHHGLDGSEEKGLAREHADEALKQLSIFGMKVWEAPPLGAGLYIRNNQPKINEVFKHSKWAGGWKDALRQIEGALATGVQRWPDSGRQAHRGTFLPADLIPEPMDLPGTYDERLLGSSKGVTGAP